MKQYLHRRSLIYLALAAVLTPFTGLSIAQGFVTFEKSWLAILTDTGRHEFIVELAISDRQQTQGLMFRRTLPINAGMLFDYRVPTHISMWMKNTFIPLDMIFIGANGRIINITQRTIPMSEVAISSNGEARAVLEVNGGTVDRLGIKIGDVVETPLLSE